MSHANNSEASLQASAVQCRPVSTGPGAWLGLKSSFARNVLVLSGGTVIGQLCTVLVMPVITRLYAPGDLGRLALYISFVGVASIVGSLRYETAIVGAADQNDAAHLMLLSALLSPITSIFAAFAFYVLVRHALLGFGNLPAIAALVVLPSLVLTGLFSSLRYWLIRQESFGLISRATVIQNVTRSLGQVILGFATIGWAGLLAGDFAGRTTGMLRMSREAWPVVFKKVFPIQVTRLKAVILRYQDFAKYVLPSSLIDTMALAIPLPLIMQFYGTEAAGHYALVQRVLALPLSVVGTSVGDSFHGRVAIYARQDREAALRFFYRTARSLLTIGIVPTITVMLLGQTLFGWVFGRTWMSAGQLATAMCPWALAQLVVSPLTRVVLVVGGQQFKLIYDLLSLAANAGVLVVGHMEGLSLLQTVWALSFFNLLAYGVYFAVLTRILKGR